MALYLAELFSNILQLIKANVRKIPRIMKLVGLAILWFICKAKKHDNIAAMPEYNYFLGHFHLVINHWRYINEYSVENAAKAGWPQLGSYSSFTSLYRHIITIYDPKIAKYVFDTKFNCFVKGYRLQRELNEILGDGIFTSDPPKWKFHRKVASRMFSMRNLKNYMFEVCSFCLITSQTQAQTHILSFIVHSRSYSKSIA